MKSRDLHNCYFDGHFELTDCWDLYSRLGKIHPKFHVCRSKMPHSKNIKSNDRSRSCELSIIVSFTVIKLLKIKMLPRSYENSIERTFLYKRKAGGYKTFGLHLRLYFYSFKVWKMKLIKQSISARFFWSKAVSSVADRTIPLAIVLAAECKITDWGNGRSRYLFKETGKKCEWRWMLGKSEELWERC